MIKTFLIVSSVVLISISAANFKKPVADAKQLADCESHGLVESSDFSFDEREFNIYLSAQYEKLDVMSESDRNWDRWQMIEPCSDLQNKS